MNLRAQISLLFLVLISGPAIAAKSSAQKLNDFEKLGIEAQAVKRVDPHMRNLINEEDKYFLDVQLGKLTEEQFKSLRSFFKNQSQVPFDSNREYELTDFLPPFAQATVNKVFLPSSLDTEGLIDLDLSSFDQASRSTLEALLNNGSSSSTNSWNTTIEVLRLMHANPTAYPADVQLYWPDRLTTSTQMKSDDISRLIKEDEVQPFDVLMISMRDPASPKTAPLVQHSALILSDTLVFEKTESTEDDAYRISFRKDVLKKYAHELADDERVIEYRRFNEAGKQSFAVDQAVKITGSLSPAAIELLKQKAPHALDGLFVTGCEMDFEKKCTKTLSQVLRAQVKIDAQSGRGVLDATPEILERFVDLESKK